jgi:hypothetical protein
MVHLSDYESGMVGLLPMPFLRWWSKTLYSDGRCGSEVNRQEPFDGVRAVGRAGRGKGWEPKFGFIQNEFTVN